MVREMNVRLLIAGLALAGATAATAFAQDRADAYYAGLTIEELEEECAKAMENARAAGPQTDSVQETGENTAHNELLACVALQQRRSN